MNIAIVGTGYVGLVSGTCFAETGNNVICIDIDPKKIDTLKNGETPIYEPGLEALLKRNIKEGRLHFTTQLAEGIKEAQFIFLALPTPPGDDGAADLKYVLGVAEQLSELIKDYKVIINKSTVPVGTAEKVAAILAKKLDPSLEDTLTDILPVIFSFTAVINSSNLETILSLFSAELTSDVLPAFNDCKAPAPMF